MVIFHAEWAHWRDQLPRGSLFVDQVLAKDKDERAGNAIMPRLALLAAVLWSGGCDDLDRVVAAVAGGVVGFVAVSTRHGLSLCGGLFIDN